MCGAAFSGLSSRGQAPASTLRDLGADRDHRVAEAVELVERLALGRLDHQRAGDREAQRRRVEAVVDQALGDVFGADAARAAGRVLQRPQVEDALVRDAAALDAGDVAAVVQLVVVGQARGDVVGADRIAVSVAARRPVAPIMRMYIQLIGSTRGVAERRRRDRADRAVVGADAAARVAGQERHQVGDDADRADARAAAAVRDAEGLVQVEVADVAAELARRGDADQRVHVGAVDVDAAAVRGGRSRTARSTRALEHAVGRRVGDHHAGQAVGVLLALRLEVGEVDVAVGVAAG